MESNSRKEFKFRIATDKDRDDILVFLRLFFYPDEPLSIGHSLSHYNSQEDEDFAVACINSGTSLMALDDKDKLAGILISGPIDRDNNDSEEVQPTDPKWNDIWELLALCEKEADICRRFNVSATLHMHILAVASHYRGQSLGIKLIKKCMELAQDNGYPMVSLDCTSNYSIRLAERLGMECVFTVVYANYKNKDGVPIFKPPRGDKCLKTFCKRL